ncbi:hypothetical protein ACFLSE_04805 [Bacteroidota bacterium]
MYFKKIKIASKISCTLILFFLFTMHMYAQNDNNSLRIQNWEKLWNPAFVDDYADKYIELEVKWIGVATNLMDACAAKKPYNNGSWIQVGIAKKDDKLNPSLNQYTTQKWKAFVKKEYSDKLFELNSDENIKIFANVKKHKNMLGNYIVLEINKIEIIQ